MYIWPSQAAICDNVFSIFVYQCDEKMEDSKLIVTEYPECPGLTVMVKLDDHAMTLYDHGDSYSP